MTWNFILNNLITYRDQRLRGAALRRLAHLLRVCAVGAVANVGVAELVFDAGANLVAGGHRRRADRRGVELHRVALLHLAARAEPKGPFSAGVRARDKFVGRAIECLSIGRRERSI